MEKNYRCRTYTPPTAEERDSEQRTMGVVSMVMDHCADDDDVSQLTQDIEKNSRFNSYTPFQRLLCGKLFSFIQVLVVHLMSWLAHLAELMLCLILRAAPIARTIWPAAIESDSLTP